MRYYLVHSLAFTYPPFVYHTESYKAAVKSGGGKNVRTARQDGRSNQPSVVTWSVDEEDAETQNRIEKELSKCPPFRSDGSLPCPIIYEKNW